jgi:hypothetical protein
LWNGWEGPARLGQEGNRQTVTQDEFESDLLWDRWEDPVSFHALGQVENRNNHQTDKSERVKVVGEDTTEWDGGDPWRQLLATSLLYMLESLLRSREVGAGCGIIPGLHIIAA